MERDIFISKTGVNYAAGLTEATGGFWTSDDLTEGGICVYNTDQTIVDGSTAVVAGDLTGTSIYIAGMGVNGFRRSVEINRKSFSFTKRVYAAPVAAVKCLGANATAAHGTLNLPSSISVGDTVGMTIRDRTKSHEDTSALINYSFAVTTGDLLTGTTSANIIVKLVALINGNSNSIATAVTLDDGTDADGIQFTADTAGNDFDIFPMDGVLKDADILQYRDLNGTYTVGLTNTVVANVIGHGTAAQATAAENESNIRLGETNAPATTRGDLFTAATNVIAGTTYTVYSVYGTQATDSPTSREVNFKQLVQIFCPSGETGVDEVIAVLDEIFALVNP